MCMCVSKICSGGGIISIVSCPTEISFRFHVPINAFSCPTLIPVPNPLSTFFFPPNSVSLGTDFYESNHVLLALARGRGRGWESKLTPG